MSLISKYKFRPVLHFYSIHCIECDHLTRRTTYSESYCISVVFRMRFYCYVLINEGKSACIDVSALTVCVWSDTMVWYEAVGSDVEPVSTDTDMSGHLRSMSWAEAFPGPCCKAPSDVTWPSLHMAGMLLHYSPSTLQVTVYFTLLLVVVVT